MKTATKHSPGPWVVEEFASCDTEEWEGAMTAITFYADENGKEGAILAWVNRWTYGDEPATEQSKANAQLIKATPDLLAACKQAAAALRSTGDNNRGFEHDIETLDKAIARAIG